MTPSCRLLHQYVLVECGSGSAIHSVLSVFGLFDSFFIFLFYLSSSYSVLYFRFSGYLSRRCVCVLPQTRAILLSRFDYSVLYVHNKCYRGFRCFFHCFFLLHCFISSVGLFYWFDYFSFFFSYVVFQCTKVGRPNNVVYNYAWSCPHDGMSLHYMCLYSVSFCLRTSLRCILGIWICHSGVATELASLQDEESADTTRYVCWVYWVSTGRNIICEEQQHTCRHRGGLRTDLSHSLPNYCCAKFNLARKGRKARTILTHPNVKP